MDRANVCGQMASSTSESGAQTSDMALGKCIFQITSLRTELDGNMISVFLIERCHKLLMNSRLRFDFLLPDLLFS